MPFNRQLMLKAQKHLTMRIYGLFSKVAMCVAWGVLMFGELNMTYVATWLE